MYTTSEQFYKNRQTRTAHLHPRRLGRIQSRVERHRVLLVWRQRSAHVDDGHLQRGGHAEPAAGRTRLGSGRTPADRQIRSFDVRVDERGQVAGMDAVLEIVSVHSGQIVIPLFRALIEAYHTQRSPECRKSSRKRIMTKS